MSEYTWFSAMKAWPLLIMASVLLLLTGCNPFRESWSWDQQLTVEVETPSGIKIGRSVTTVVWRDVDAFGNYSSTYDGAATVVEVASGRHLFLTLDPDVVHLARYTFAGSFGKDGSKYEELFPTLSKSAASASVPDGKRPLMVVFDNENDPLSVRRIDPENLSDFFGPGHSLKRLYLTLNEKGEQSLSIGEIIPWIEKYRGIQLDGSRYETIYAKNRLANSLSASNFETRK